MGKNKDRKKKGVAVQKTATKAKKKTEKDLKKQIEQLGEVDGVKIEGLILIYLIQENIEQLISKQIGKENAIEAVVIEDPSETPPSRR